MDTERFKRLQEHALIALTYIEYDQNSDRIEAEANKKVILEAYTKPEINEGALLALTALMAYEAYVLDMPLSQRIAQIREIVRDGLEAKDEPPTGE